MEKLRRGDSGFLRKILCRDGVRGRLLRPDGIDVDGEFVLIRDIMGEEIRLQGKIKMVDLANSIVELDCE